MNFTREELLKAVRNIDENPDLKVGRHSSTYDLIHDNKKYPPILILSEANILKGGKEITLEDYGNNVEIPFKILRDNGFEIVSKKTSSNDSFFHQLTEFLRQARTENLKTKHFISEHLGCKVKVSFGQGGAAKIPWISFLKTPHTTSKGIYPVYLYYKQFEILILAYGVSETNDPLENWKGIEETSSIKDYFLSNYNTKPDRYGASDIFKVYNVNELPSKKVIDSDLKQIIDQYNSQTVKENKLVEKEILNILRFKVDLDKSSLQYSPQLITRLVASLMTKPFVLLTGLSGSGKTKLAQSFVTWICEAEDQYRIIPVGADWTNREPLLGYPNGLDPKEYILPDCGALTTMIEAGKAENQHKPYFLILDEMNLSHVERYFADFLSVMESDDRIMLYSGSERMANGDEVPRHISWPRNLFVIGTVNIDETTYMFSPKVLDRANTIEFRISNREIQKFLSSPAKTDLSLLKGNGAPMAESFLDMAQDKSIAEDEFYTETFVRFFDELRKIGAEFGYRTAVEMLLLIQKLNQLGTADHHACLDIAVMQKLLPKLHGSRSKISKVLDALIGLCLNEGQTFSISKSDELNAEETRYPLAFEKLVRMYRNALDNGFTSYAEA